LFKDFVYVLCNKCALTRSTTGDIYIIYTYALIYLYVAKL